MGRIVKATFLENSRRFSYWSLTILVLIAAVLSYPRTTGPLKVFVLDPSTYLQASNPTWVPVSVALVLGLCLPIISYLFLRSADSIEQQSDVAVLMDSVEFSKIKYIMGKFLSNCLLLLLWSVVVLGACSITIFQFPGYHINWNQFIPPFLTLLPCVLLVSALSLFMGAVPGLNGNLGIIVFSFFSLLCYGISATNYDSLLLKLINPSGSSHIEDSSIRATGHPLRQTMLLSGGAVKQTGSKELIFHAISFTRQDALVLVLQLLLSLLLLALAGLLFAPHKLWSSLAPVPRNKNKRLTTLNPGKRQITRS